MSILDSVSNLELVSGIASVIAAFVVMILKNDAIMGFLKKVFGKGGSSSSSSESNLSLLNVYKDEVSKIKTELQQKEIEIRRMHRSLDEQKELIQKFYKTQSELEQRAQLVTELLNQQMKKYNESIKMVNSLRKLLDDCLNGNNRQN